MTSWTSYPDCLVFDIDVENTFKVPDPLWPGLGFLIAFIIGGIIGGLLSKLCIKSYLNMRRHDEETATLIAQGVPLHMRGREKKKVYGSAPPTMTVGNEGSVATQITTSNSDLRQGMVTPSNVLMETSSKGGLSDALIKSTGEGAEAEIVNQDVQDFMDLEHRRRDEGIEDQLNAIQVFLNGLVAEGVISQESADAIINTLRKKISDVIEDNINQENAAIRLLNDNQDLQQDEIARQLATNKIHADAVQKINRELMDVKQDLPRLLASTGTMTEDDIVSLMTKLKHQLSTREKKVDDETRRQIQAMEERLARRRELAEQNRLRKEAAAETVVAKIEQQSKSLQLLVNNNTITEKQKDEIMKKYEQDLWRLHNAQNEERSDQERLLNEKLAKKRRIRMKKLAAQQNKAKADLQSRLKKSTNKADVQTYADLMNQQQMEMEQTIADLDTEEANQMNHLIESTQTDFNSQYSQADQEFAEELSAKTDIDEADVRKIIKLHKAEMKEFDRNRQNQQKVMETKLKEKLALRKQKKEESDMEDQRAFEVVNTQQEEMIRIVQQQADLTEDVAAKIMEEHKTNMEKVNNQLSISKMRQEKQLEEKLAQRRAKLAEKQAALQALAHSEEEQKMSDLQKAEQQIQEEKLKIKQDRQKALAALKESIAKETEQALAAQELQISQLIGEQEAGQARRRNIIQKQEKLLSELENQLANKVGENPRGYTTTTELMQKHYGQVETLNNSLRTTKERQEQALQEKIEQKRIQREAEIRQMMKMEAQKELEKMRARGAGVASNILLDMMLKQRHERAMLELDQEMKVELQRAKDKMNEELHAEIMTALSDEGKSFMADLAANSDLSNEDLTDAMKNAAKSIQANDQTVKKLAKEMRVRVKTAKGERSQH